MNLPVKLSMKLIPGLARLSGYPAAWLRPDLVAGVTVGAMLVPQGMAYAELAGMPPITGCYAALLPLVAYALLGSSKHLGVGPEPGTAILAATGVGMVAEGDPVRFVALMAALALLVGVICLVGAALRLGFIAQLLSKPVIVGYITGVGLTLLSSQLGNATGLTLVASTPWGRGLEVIGRLDEVDGLTLAVFLGTLALQQGLRRIAPTVPDALVGVAAATGFALVVGPDAGLATVGAITSGLPQLQVPAFAMADIVALAPAALGVSLVGYADNVVTARAFAQRAGEAVDANQELVALGVCNLGAGVLGGFPVAASASRTAVSADTGAQSGVSHLVACAFLALVLWGLGPWLAIVPMAALGSVIASAGLSIIDVRGFRHLAQVSRSEWALALGTAVGVMAFDVLTGILAAVSASIVLALARIAFPSDAVLADSAQLDGWVDADQYGVTPPRGALLVYRFDAPLFFANANRFRDRLLRLLQDHEGGQRFVVLDFEGIGDVDATALDMLRDLADVLQGRKIQVSIARANPRALDRVATAGLLAPDGPVQSHATILGAVRATEHQA